MLGKAFLGLTIACARCHDHKFDAITTKDYYALNGILASSRHSPGLPRPALEDRPQARRVGGDPPPGRGRCRAVEPSRPWPSDADSPDIVFESFDGPTYEGWFVNGDAFGTGPTRPGDWRIKGDKVEALEPGVAHSGAISDRLRGVLRSKTFTLTKPYVHYLASGKGGRINLVVDGFEKIRAPIYGDLVHDVNSDAFAWTTMDVAQWVGHTAYIEIDDGATVDFTGGQSFVRDGRGFIAVDEIRFSDGPAPAVPARIGARTRCLRRRSTRRSCNRCSPATARSRRPSPSRPSARP